MSINEARNEIMSSMGYAEAIVIGKQEVQEVAYVISSQYYDGANAVDIESAIVDLGIRINKESRINGIEVSDINEVTFHVDGEAFDSDTTTIILIRMMGIYLFTNELNGVSIFEDRELDPLSEEIVNYFLILMSIPGVDPSSHISTQDLVRWAIETRIPFQVLKNALI